MRTLQRLTRRISFLIALAIAAVSRAGPTISVRLECAPQPRGDGTGLLFREVLRQSFLIAARDECGLVAADAALGDRSPPDAAGFLLKVRYPGGRGVPASLDAIVAPSTRPTTQPATRPFATPSVHAKGPTERLLPHVVEAESDSRTLYVDALVGVGAMHNAPKWDAALPVPAAIEEQIEKLDLVDQFEAARALHALIRSDGESPARLGALARVYAHLFHLTRTCWGVEPKIFAARALLYGQRGVIKAPADKLASASNAYVLTLLGEQIDARNELERLATLQGDNPAWVAPLQLFLDDDSDALALIENISPVGRLAAYLDFMLAESGFAEAVVRHKGWLATRRDAFVDTVDNRLAMVRDTQVRARLLTEAVSKTNACLAKAFLALPDQSQSMKNAALALTAFGPDVSARRPLIDLLLREDRADTGPLPRAALGRLIQEISFNQAAFQTATSYFNDDAIDVRAIDRALVVVRESPYATMLEAFKEMQTDRADADRRMNDALGLDFARTNNALDRFTINYPDDDAMSKAFLTRTADLQGAMLGDVQWEMRWLKGTNHWRLESAKWAGRDMSKDDALMLATRIDTDWPAERKHLEMLRDRAHKDATVAVALARKLEGEQRFAEASEVWSLAVDRSPDHATVRCLAVAQLFDGHFDSFVDTLQRHLDTLAPDSDQAATIHRTLAFALALRGDADAALPHALHSGEPDTGNASMSPELYVRERQGDWDRAEALVKRETTGAESISWPEWCAQTGHGDLKLACDTSTHAIEAAINGEITREQQVDIAGNALFSGDLATATAEYRALCDFDGEPYAAIQSALLALERGDNAERDAALAAALEHGPTALVDGEPRLWLVELARLLQHDLADPQHPAALEAAVDALVVKTPVAASTGYYFAGRQAELTHRPALARACYEKSLVKGKRHYTSVAMAALRYRAMGNDPLPLLWTADRVVAEVDARVALSPWRSTPRPTTDPTTQPTTTPASNPAAAPAEG